MRAAAYSTAKYTASPTSPCSAATVTGMVCEAAAARCELTSSRSRKVFSNEPEPKPKMGLARNMLPAAAQQVEAPAGGLVERARRAGIELDGPRRDQQETPTASAAAPASGPPTSFGGQRSAAEHCQAHEQRHEARLREREEKPGPQNGERGRHAHSASMRLRDQSSAVASPIMTIAR